MQQLTEEPRKLSCEKGGTLVTAIYRWISLDCHLNKNRGNSVKIATACYDEIHNFGAIWE